MKKSLLILLVIQLFLEINCYVPYINACFDNKKVLKDSLTLLRASVYNKNRWEPPVGYIPDKHKKVKWEPPVGYIPDRLRNQDIINDINKEIEKCDNKDDLYTNEKENIEIEIDKILIKIEKIKKNVKNIKKYNKNEY
jgi:hypothetical protein